LRFAIDASDGLFTRPGSCRRWVELSDEERRREATELYERNRREMAEQRERLRQQQQYEQTMPKFVAAMQAAPRLPVPRPWRKDAYGRRLSDADAHERYRTAFVLTTLGFEQDVRSPWILRFDVPDLAVVKVFLGSSPEGRRPSVPRLPIELSWESPRTIGRGGGAALRDALHRAGVLADFSRR